MPVVIGFAGNSGSGKTTLIAYLVHCLRNKGWKVAVIKHDPHGHYKEVEGTDSDNFMRAGADCVIVSGPNKISRTERHIAEPELSEVVASLSEFDIVLVEGNKQSDIPKIAVMLHEWQIDVLDRLHGPVIAIAAAFEWTNRHPEISTPVLNLQQPGTVADWICQSLLNQD